MLFPKTLLKRLYTRSSLKRTARGFTFELKNRLADARVTHVYGLKVNDSAVSVKSIRAEIATEDGTTSRSAATISKREPLPFPLRNIILVHVDSKLADLDKHQLELDVVVRPFGRVTIPINDEADVEDTQALSRIPRSTINDYTPSAIETRQTFLNQAVATKPKHLYNYTIDPQQLSGNIENFTGIAQMPIGLAGPLLVNGEHAQGSFLVPLATTEGTLVASYSRGMKVLAQSGGVMTTISDDVMQRAPVFVFSNARQSRDFVRWIDENLVPIRAAAEATSSVAQLQYIENYLSNKFAYLRFNFTTGDAAGQNMVNKATFAACDWILENYDGARVENFYLESNFATDKKFSQINTLMTRGKRVTSEAIIPREILEENLHTTPEKMVSHYHVANVGAIMSGASNNGLHASNGLAALFIATGQDVANVAESQAALTYAEVRDDGSLYMSVTLPSLIVATWGGGTGLPTQRECLELLDCYGKGKVRKFAEIASATVLAGDLSLAAAISSADWVSSHERLGRNR